MRGWLLEHLDDGLSLAGGCALVRGMTLWSPAAGWIMAGLLLLMAGWGVARDRAPRTERET